MADEVKTDALAVTEKPGAIVNWEEQLAKDAREEAAKEKVFASKIGKAGGKVQIAGQDVGESIQAVVLGSAFMKTLYEVDYNEDDPTPPSCWAVAEDQDNLIADPEKCWKVVHPEGCKGCPADQFKTGRGNAKACGDRRRLIVMAANDLKDAETIQRADVYTVEISATGLKAWAFFVKGLRDTFGRPPYGMITELRPQQMKTWYIWNFKPLQIVPNEVMAAVMAKRQSILDQLLAGWDKPTEDPALKAAKNQPKKF